MLAAGLASALETAANACYSYTISVRTTAECVGR